MNRGLIRTLTAALRPQHYVAVANSHVYVDWAEFFVRRYILGRGKYPYASRIRTPLGIVTLVLYCPEDCFTVNEIFALHCYRADTGRVFVDFGANIGVSAAYFLSRNPGAYVHCFEPLAENVVKLRRNLAPFDGRYSISEVALADYDGQLSFRVEPTGRYSGIDNEHGLLREVPCVNADRVIDALLQTHGKIDLLKVDVEGAETLFIPQLQERNLERIGVICVEGKDVLASARFRRTKSVSGVLRYTRIDSKRDQVTSLPAQSDESNRYLPR